MRVTPVAFPLMTLLLLAACGPGPTDLAPGPLAPVAPKAVVSLVPEPGPFTGTLTVTLSTDHPATLRVTTDGSDPAGEGALTGNAPMTVELTATSTIRYVSRTEVGVLNGPHEASYERIGPAPGSISGTLTAGASVGGYPLFVLVGSTATPVEGGAPGTFAFETLDNAPGEHLVRAFADRNGNGRFDAPADHASAGVTVTLEAEDPARAGAENVALRLDVSLPELATLEGTVTLPRPPRDHSVTVLALDPTALGAGDPAGLLDVLDSGYSIPTRTEQTDYPYALTDLAPGLYVPVPAVMSTNAFGIPAATLFVAPLRTVLLAPGATATADFTFGPTALNGSVTFPAGAPPLFVVMVAARHVTPQGEIQAALVPALVLVGGAASFVAPALLADADFELKVFAPASLAEVEATATEAFGWILQGGSPDATVRTQGTTTMVTIAKELP
jgi:hypothetical protein